MAERRLLEEEKESSSTDLSLDLETAEKLSAPPDSGGSDKLPSASTTNPDRTKIWESVARGAYSYLDSIGGQVRPARKDTTKLELKNPYLAEGKTSAIEQEKSVKTTDGESSSSEKATDKPANTSAPIKAELELPQSQKPEPKREKSDLAPQDEQREVPTSTEKTILSRLKAHSEETFAWQSITAAASALTHEVLDSLSKETAESRSPVDQPQERPEKPKSDSFLGIDLSTPLGHYFAAGPETSFRTDSRPARPEREDSVHAKQAVAKPKLDSILGIDLSTPAGHFSAPAEVPYRLNHGESRAEREDSSHPSAKQEDESVREKPKLDSILGIGLSTASGHFSAAAPETYHSEFRPPARVEREDSPHFTGKPEETREKPKLDSLLGIDLSSPPGHYSAATPETTYRDREETRPSSRVEREDSPHATNKPAEENREKSKIDSLLGIDLSTPPGHYSAATPETAYRDKEDFRLPGKASEKPDAPSKPSSDEITWQNLASAATTVSNHVVNSLVPLVNSNDRQSKEAEPRHSGNTLMEMASATTATLTAPLVSIISTVAGHTKEAEKPSTSDAPASRRESSPEPTARNSGWFGLVLDDHSRDRTADPAAGIGKAGQPTDSTGKGPGGDSSSSAKGPGSPADVTPGKPAASYPGEAASGRGGDYNPYSAGPDSKPESKSTPVVKDDYRSASSNEPPQTKPASNSVDTLYKPAAEYRPNLDSKPSPSPDFKPLPESTGTRFVDANYPATELKLQAKEVAKPESAPVENRAQTGSQSTQNTPQSGSPAAEAGPPRQIDSRTTDSITADRAGNQGPGRVAGDPLTTGARPADAGAVPHANSPNDTLRPATDSNQNRFDGTPPGQHGAPYSDTRTGLQPTGELRSSLDRSVTSPPESRISVEPQHVSEKNTVSLTSPVQPATPRADERNREPQQGPIFEPGPTGIKSGHPDTPNSGTGPQFIPTTDGRRTDFSPPPLFPPPQSSGLPLSQFFRNTSDPDPGRFLQVNPITGKLEIITVSLSDRSQLSGARALEPGTIISGRNTDAGLPSSLRFAELLPPLPSSRSEVLPGLTGSRGDGLSPAGDTLKEIAPGPARISPELAAILRSFAEARLDTTGAIKPGEQGSRVNTDPTGRTGEFPDLRTVKIDGRMADGTRVIDGSGRIIDPAGRGWDIPVRSGDLTGKTVDITGRSVDISGRTVDITGRNVDISGRTADITGRNVDISGRTVDITGRGLDVSGRPVRLPVQISGLAGPDLRSLEPRMPGLRSEMNYTGGKRYLISEIGLAIVLAAGGIRRVLPSDRMPSSTKPGEGGKKTAIERGVQPNKTPVMAGERSSKFWLSKDGLLRSTTESGKSNRLTEQLYSKLDKNQLMLDKKGAGAFFKALALETRGALNAVQAPKQQMAIAEGQIDRNKSIRANFINEKPTNFEEIFAETTPETKRNFVLFDDPFMHSGLSAESSDKKKRGAGVQGSESLSRTVGDESDSEEEKEKQPQVLVRPTCLIREGETLVSIAENLFCDPNIAWLIADLNCAESKEHWMDGKRIVEFNSRQQITLPVWEDVVDFYKALPANADHDNLITIVRTTRLDRDVIESALGKIMGTRLPGAPSIRTSGMPGAIGSVEELVLGTK